MNNKILSEKEREFFDFVYNRQLIWYKRFVLNQKSPWTNDPVLSKYKIINVYRELDKGTLYILDKLKGVSDRKTLILNIVFYRFFNRFNLYENLDLSIMKDFSEKQKADLKISLAKLNESEPVFNDAYLIAGKIGEIKYASVLDSLSWLWKNIDQVIEKIDKSKTPEESFSVIKEIPLVGNFLAYEIWTDLTYFDFFNQKWNEDDFVNIGPGAKWGLEIIYGKSNLELLKKLHAAQASGLNEKNPPWNEISYKKAFVKKPFLSLANIENSLCEFRKYHNLSKGAGKKRYFTAR